MKEGYELLLLMALLLLTIGSFLHFSRSLRRSEGRLNRELMNLERALRTNEGFIKALLDGVRSGVMLIDENWKVSLINREFEDYFGLKKDDLLGMDLIKCFPKLSRYGVDGRLMNNLLEASEGEPRSYEAEYISKEKGKRIYNYFLSLLQGGAVVIVNDLTTRKEMEEERARLRKEMERSNKRLKQKLSELSTLYEISRKNYFDTIQALALAIEARDPYTRGHSERITNYALDIAEELRLSKDELKTIQYAGRLHDIGKIAIRDAILSKPDRLTVAEWAEVKLHPLKGAEMLLPLDFLENAIPSVRHHHERFDGRGYPDRLIKGRIPLLARILALADAFDAMTSNRPYRDAFSTEKAIEELRTNSGSQFDPELTKAFLRILERGRG